MGHLFLKQTVTGHIRKVCTTSSCIVLVTSQGYVHVLNYHCEHIRTLEIGHITAADNAVVVHDIDSLIIGDKSGAVSLWSLGEGKQQKRWHFSEHPVTAVTLVGGPVNLLASSYTDGSIRIIDRATGTLFHSAVQNRLVSASWEGGIKIWDVLSGDCLFTISAPAQYVCIVQNVDEKIVCGCQDNQSLQIWSISDGSLMNTLTPATSVWGTLSLEAYSTAEFHGLISSHKDASIRIWDCDRAIQLYAFDTGKSKASFLKVVMAGAYDGEQAVHRIVTGHRRSVVKLWRIPAVPSASVSGDQGTFDEGNPLPSPGGEKLIQHKDTESFSYGNPYPLSVVTTPTGIAVTTSVMKINLRPFHDEGLPSSSSSSEVQSVFHLLHFDANAW